MYEIPYTENYNKTGVNTQQLGLSPACLLVLKRVSGIIHSKLGFTSRLNLAALKHLVSKIVTKASSEGKQIHSK